VPDLPLYPEEAAKALRCFKRLKLPDVIGTPTLGSLRRLVPADRGQPVRSYDKANNVRRISEVFQLIPKGNSKSTNGGAVMMTAIIVNRRPEQNFCSLPDHGNAAIAYKQRGG